MYTRAHDSLSRRRNIYYSVHRPAEVESSRVGAGKGSRAANCPPSYPPYTLPHTNVVTHCSSFSHQFILSYFFSHCFSLFRLTQLCRLTAPASKALDYLPLISARVAHLLPRLLLLPRTKPPSFLSSLLLLSILYWLPFLLTFFLPPSYLQFQEALSLYRYNVRPLCKDHRKAN